MIKVHRTVFIPVDFYGCETWSLTLRDELRLRVFEDRLMRRIFEPKMDEVEEDSRRLNNEELYALYSLPVLFGRSNKEE